MDIGTELPRSSCCGDEVGSHAIFLFDGRVESPLESALGFTAAGIEAGDSVVLILPDSLLDEASKALRDVKASQPSRKLVISTLQNHYLEHGRFSGKKALRKWGKLIKLAGPGAGIRAFAVGDHKVAADKLNTLKLIEYESAINRCFPIKMGVCCYDTSLFHTDIVESAEKCHPFLWDGTSVQPNSSYIHPDEFFNWFYEQERRTFEWTAEPASCWKARHAVAEIAARMPFDLTEIDDLVLAVGEAFTNAVRHGSPNGKDNKITVTVTPSGNCITVDITDEGCGIKCEPDRIDWTEPGGKGLYMIRRLCHHVEHISCESGCTIRLVKHSKRPRF